MLLKYPNVMVDILLQGMAAGGVSTGGVGQLHKSQLRQDFELVAELNVPLIQEAESSAWGPWMLQGGAFCKTQNDFKNTGRIKMYPIVTPKNHVGTPPAPAAGSCIIRLQ